MQAAETIDWGKTLGLAGSALGVAIIAFGWRIIRPALARFVVYLLDTDDGRTYFAEYLAKMLDVPMTEIRHDVSSTKSAVRTVQALFERMETTQKQHGEQIGEIREATRDIPTLAAGLPKLEQLGSKLTETLQSLARQVERMEGRYEAVFDPPPKRRRGE